MLPPLGWKVGVEFSALLGPSRSCFGVPGSGWPEAQLVPPARSTSRTCSSARSATQGSSSPQGPTPMTAWTAKAWRPCAGTTVLWWPTWSLPRCAACSLTGVALHPRTRIRPLNLLPLTQFLTPGPPSDLVRLTALLSLTQSDPWGSTLWLGSGSFPQPSSLRLWPSSL